MTIRRPWRRAAAPSAVAVAAAAAAAAVAAAAGVAAVSPRAPVAPWSPPGGVAAAAAAVPAAASVGDRLRLAWAVLTAGPPADRVSPLVLHGHGGAPPPLSRSASAPAPAAGRDGPAATRLRPIPQVIGGEPTEDPRLIRSLARLLHPPKGGGPPAYFCVGVLVTERHLLTAAHCATAVGDSVALGSAAMYGGFNRSVVKVTAHPSSVPPAYTMADIAVVEFEAPASAAAARATLDAAGVGPAALTLDPALPGVNLSVVLAGWGPTTEAGTAKGIAAQPLTAVAMRTWEPLDCHTFHDQVLKDVPADQFCAGGGGKRSCTGDSGSPLVVLRPAPAPLLVVGLVEGAVSLFNRPCTVLAPVVSTRISPYKWWIQGVVGASKLTIEGKRKGT